MYIFFSLSVPTPRSSARRPRFYFRESPFLTIVLHQSHKHLSFLNEWISKSLWWNDMENSEQKVLFKDHMKGILRLTDTGGVLNESLLKAWWCACFRLKSDNVYYGSYCGHESEGKKGCPLSHSLTASSWFICRPVSDHRMSHVSPEPSHSCPRTLLIKKKERKELA